MIQEQLLKFTSFSQVGEPYILYGDLLQIAGYLIQPSSVLAARFSEEPSGFLSVFFKQSLEESISIFEIM